MRIKVSGTIRKIEPEKFSSSWFAAASEEDLLEEREPFRVASVYKGDENATKMMGRIDSELRRRAVEKSGPVDPSKLPHREHGWYLPNDDDDD